MRNQPTSRLSLVKHGRNKIWANKRRLSRVYCARLWRKTRGETQITSTNLTLPFGIEGTDIRSHRHFRPSACRCRSDRNCGRISGWRGLWRSPNKWHTWAPSSGRLQMLRQWPFSRAKHRRHNTSAAGSEVKGGNENGLILCCVTSRSDQSDRAALISFVLFASFPLSLL